MKQYKIVETTAEDVVEVVDAVLAKPTDCNIEFIEEYTDLPREKVENAIHMSKELELIKEESNIFYKKSYLSRVLVSASSDKQKAAVMRLVIEEYPPFVEFKRRFLFSSTSVQEVCRKVKVIFSMSISERSVKSTLISLATYGRAMISEGGEKYTFNQDETNYMLEIENCISLKSGEDAALSKILGKKI